MSRLLPLYRVINAVNFRYGSGIIPPVPSKHTSNIQIFPSFPRFAAESETVLSTVPCKIHRYPPSAWFHLCRKNIPRSSQSEKSLPFPGYIPPESFFHSNYNIIYLPLSRFYPPCQITTHDNGMLCRFSIKILAKPTGLKSMFLIQLLCGNVALSHFQIDFLSSTLLCFHKNSI